MKQIEATKDRPFYSVCYQYESNPYALWSCNRYGKGRNGAGRTMQGTDSLELAKATADRLVTEGSICFAEVYVSFDCYNHNPIYQAKSIAKPAA